MIAQYEVESKEYRVKISSLESKINPVIDNNTINNNKTYIYLYILILYIN